MKEIKITGFIEYPKYKKEIAEKDQTIAELKKEIEELNNIIDMHVEKNKSLKEKIERIRKALESSETLDTPLYVIEKLLKEELDAHGEELLSYNGKANFHNSKKNCVNTLHEHYTCQRCKKRYGNFFGICLDCAKELGYAKQIRPKEG